VTGGGGAAVALTIEKHPARHNMPIYYARDRARASVMTILGILTYPDPRLEQPSAPVKDVDAKVVRLIEDMAETMYQAPGIGLAAPQVNVHKRIIVVDVSEERNHLLALVNPEIIERDGEQEFEEGCLSVPGVYAPVSRSARIRVHALNREGKAFEFDTDGLLAVCIQHEIDHLDGKVFVEYLSRLKRERIRKKLLKQQRQAM
jgi:peptide deformylase